MLRPVTPSPTPGVPEPFVAPVGGWNAKDPQAAMRPTDAVTLINWVPRENNIVTRLGYSEAQDLETGSAVSALFHFEHGSEDQLIAASGDKLWNVDTGTELSATTFGSGNWIADVMTNRLFLVNGVDTMQVYDGTTLADATFTGGPVAPFSYVKAYKSRIYAAESNSKKVWYGPLGGITGALAEFDLGLIGGLSGNLLAIRSFSRDGAKNNRDDLIAFIFTSGDVAVYSGSDPSDPADWALHGRFKIGRPLSINAFLETETDLYALTNRGYEQLSRTMPLGTETTRAALLSDKISTAVTESVAALPFDSGWRVSIVPSEAIMIVNVPDTTGGSTQHVRNINTGAWTKFTGLDIASMVVRGQRMHFGTSDGRIMRYGDSSSDNGAAIYTEVQTAWSSLRRKTKSTVTHVQLLFVASYMPPIAVSVGANFVDPQPGVYATFTNSSALPAQWDTALWDEAQWADETKTYMRMFKRSKRGNYLATRIAMSVKSRVQWNSITYLLQSGGIL